MADEPLILEYPDLSRRAALLVTQLARSDEARERFLHDPTSLLDVVLTDVVDTHRVGRVAQERRVGTLMVVEIDPLWQGGEALSDAVLQDAEQVGIRVIAGPGTDAAATFGRES